MKGVKLLLFFIACAFQVQAQEEKRTLNQVVQLKGYVKSMQTFQAASLDYISHSNLIHNRLNFRVYASDKITVGLELRSRVFTGDQVQFNPLFSQSVNVDNGLVDLSWLWLDEPGVVGLSQVDRGWIKYSSQNWDVTIGRQRINWGLNTFWNSNDLFNTFNLTDFDYEERPGSDAVRVQHYFKDYSTLEFAIAPSLNDSTWVGAGLYKFNKWTYDIQFIAGWWNQDVALGVGWAGNIKTAGFKGELTYFQPRENWQNQKGSLSASISLDYMFTGNWYLMGGFLYSSNGTLNPINLGSLATSTFASNEPPSAKTLMPTRYNTMLSLSKPITPLINGSLVALYAPGTNLLFLMPSVSVSVASNWDLSLFAQSTFLDNTVNFRNYGTSAFLRLKWGF